jgi:hypothetical protein
VEQRSVKVQALDVMIVVYTFGFKQANDVGPLARPNKRLTLMMPEFAQVMYSVGLPSA